MSRWGGHMCCFFWFSVFLELKIEHFLTCWFPSSQQLSRWKAPGSQFPNRGLLFSMVLPLLLWFGLFLELKIENILAHWFPSRHQLSRWKAPGSLLVGWAGMRPVATELYQKWHENCTRCTNCSVVPGTLYHMRG